MSDETVRPALTAEEWKELACHVPLETVKLANDLEGRPMLGITHHQEGDRWTALGTRQLHQAAALALHGQPFGFTRDDVYLLTGLAHQSYAFRIMAENAAQLRKLAGRIAALLPPEEIGGPKTP